MLKSHNTASQALHNAYEFFKNAGHKQNFLDNIRFFLVIANFEGIRVYIHWATEC